MPSSSSRTYIVLFVNIIEHRFENRFHCIEGDLFCSNSFEIFLFQTTFLGRHRYGRPHDFLNDPDEDADEPLSSFFFTSFFLTSFFFSFISSFDDDDESLSSLFFFRVFFNHICG